MMTGAPQSLFASHLPRIPEEELTMEKVVLGEGAYSIVQRATWTHTIAVGRRRVHTVQVAVKMANRHSNSQSEASLLSAELSRDLEVISSLPHQNILTLFGVCESQGNKSTGPKVVFELMHTDLAKEIRRLLLERNKSQGNHDRQLFPTHVLLRMLRDVSSGLAHLHANGVVHRDVKPGNVLLRDEQLKLCDFGSSKDLKQSIQQMSVAGTLDYMAPEMMKRQAAGRPADVWSFGVLLFECVTGEVCAGNLSLAELTAQLIQAGCLPQLAQIFAECHSKEPLKRPTMADVNLRLQQLVMQHASDFQRLKEELKRAEAQDHDTYERVWSDYASQPQCPQLLEHAKQMASSPQQAQSALFLVFS